jgi:hypothetical protein
MNMDHGDMSCIACDVDLGVRSVSVAVGAEGDDTFSEITPRFGPSPSCDFAGVACKANAINTAITQQKARLHRL